LSTEALWPPRTAGSGRTRSAGTKTSWATVLTLPEPRSPEVCQSSTISRSDSGTRAITGYGSPSGGTRIAMISCHWLCSAPLMNPHLPLTTMPPSAGVAVADGLSVPHTRTSGVAKTSSCTSSGKSPAIQVGIQETDAIHAAPLSARPSSAATSTSVRASAS
jgi:hypothetical protein